MRRINYNCGKRVIYTYDGRGNLVKEEYGKLNGNGNNKRTTVAEYTYDETNKMVKGVNSIGESSSYLFNGKDALVEQTWKIAKNGYGYHDVDAGVSDPVDTSNGKSGNGSGGKGSGNGNGQGNGNGKGDKPTGTTVGSFSTVVKQFVIDYSVETMDPLMEHEVNGLDYRYVYGNERLSVNVSPIVNGSGHIVESGTVGQQIRLYYHQDLRGTVDYLTSPVSQKVESWTHYNEWGEITHNAVLKCGQRELDLVKNYTGHDFDAVLNMYYAKARMYDAENRRFVSIDPILDGTKYDLSEYTTEAINFSAYVYVQDNPLRWVDPLGLSPQKVKKNDVQFRPTRGTKNTPICSLNYGTIVNSVSDNEYAYYVDGHYWTRVEYQGRVGWIANEYLDNDATTKAKSGVQYIVDASALNVRQWPSTYAKKIDTLPTNAGVTTLGEECVNEGYTWAKVRVNATGKQGWVATKYLTQEKTNSSDVSYSSVTISNMMLYQTKRRPGLEEDGSDARDMKEDYKTKFELRDEFLDLGNKIAAYKLFDYATLYDAPSSSSSVLPSQGPKALEDMLRGLMSLGSLGDQEMHQVVLSMADHFIDGTGTEFSSDILNDRVKKHNDTIRFINQNQEVVERYIKKYNGDIRNISVDPNFKDAMWNVRSVSFAETSDYLNGLIIGVHGTWAYDIELIDYKFDGKNYSGSIRYTIYDHFGLDNTDLEGVEKFDNGFYAWYILQHYENARGKYAPFVTRMEVEKSFSGSI